jgi:hypothetical protein
MRRFAITTIALLGLAAPGAALAQGAAQPPARQQVRPRHSRPLQRRPMPTDRVAQSFEPTARNSSSGPPDERGRRSGALSALPGPARRRAVLELPLLVRQTGRHVELRGARRQRRLPRPGVLRELRAGRQAVAQRQLAADSAVLQRRYDDAVYGQRTARCCSTTRHSARSRTGRPTSTPTSRWRRRSNCASGATSAGST